MYAVLVLKYSNTVDRDILNISLVKILRGLIFILTNTHKIFRMFNLDRRRKNTKISQSTVRVECEIGGMLSIA
jgi:hypothetical protein